MPGVSVYVVVSTLLMFSGLLQNQDPQQTNPSTPAGGAQQQHSQQTAPAPQTDSSANQRIKSSISDLLSSDPVLGSADVEVAVDDRDITLSGAVESYAQHQRVLQLTAQYGRWRKIVDKIKMK